MEAIFVDKSTFDFPIFLLFFNAKFPIFPIFSVRSFLFSYFFEQPCRWTPCSTSEGLAYIWQTKWVGIIAKKAERSKFTF